MKTNILKTLDDLKINFDEISHIVSTSCDHSKILRKESGLEGVGSKNIVFHAKQKFYIVITLGDKNIKARKFKKEFGTKDIRFANPEEIKENLNGTIGCIPSFGYKNNEIPVFVDAEIFEHEYFMFNPDNPEKTIRLKTSDLKKIYKNMKNPVKFFRVSDDDFEIIEKIS